MVRKNKKQSEQKEPPWQPPDAQTPDILMTLPPELRNHIYNYALVLPSGAVRVGTRKAHAAWEKVDVWREPGILRASKTIRAEASSIYYRDNDFVLEVKLQDMLGLCRWLNTLVKLCGPRLFKTGSIEVTHPMRRHLYKGVWLTKLFHVAGPVIEPMGGQLLKTSHGDQWRVEDALITAIKIGKKASEEGWDKKRTACEVQRWQDLFEETKHAKRDSRTWKLIVEV